MLGIEFRITIDSEEFIHHEGPKINYSEHDISGQGYWIKSHPLLFEEIIIPQNIACFDWKGAKAFFRTTTGDHTFDIFAACFYLISRYEEYLPHEKDLYGRYAHENALAFREGFLDLPLINIWVKDLAERLKEKYSIFHFKFSLFHFKPSYDIDIAYAYKHKGLLRNAGGFFRSPSRERINVLLGLKTDPFDCYDWLNGLHDQYALHPVYFFLVAGKNSVYDKNILPHKNAMWQLVKRHVKKYEVGLHPSWQSGDDGALLKKEKEQLEAMCEGGHTPVTHSRQHYIRFNLPLGYQQLIGAGITHDHSMGYGSINGFRASVASSFFWYDLENEAQTPLRVHPFCFMEANSYYEQKQTATETFDELMHYYSQCRSVGAELVTIWHNNFLGSDKTLTQWKEIYRRFIAQVRQ